MRLRDYQQRLIDGALRLWQDGFRRIAMVLGTGGGKTVIFSSLAGMAREQGKPVLVLAHRTELIEQAADKLRQVNPGARIGIMQAARRQWRAEIVVGSVQTCSRPGALTLLKAAGFGLIVIDECHHAPANSYMTILTELGAYEAAGPLVLGVTATLDRADNLALSSVFEEVVDPVIGLRELIMAKPMPWLVPPRGVRVRVQGLDLSKVRSVGGDLDSGQTARAMHDALAPAAIARAYLERAAGRSGLCFMPTVALSQEMARVFVEHGVAAEHVDGTTAPELRALAIKRSREGELRMLCNVGLFTEGTDMPWIDCLVLGQPTKSRIRYQQTIGRGVRLFPGKRDCIVLDVVGVTGKHRLATLDNLEGAEQEEALPPELSLYDDDWDEDAPDEPEAAADAHAAAVLPDEPYGADGQLDHELVDLFGSAHASWLRTPGGTFFLAAGPHQFVYLYAEDDGLYHVQARPRAGGATITLQWGMEIGYAMAWGEQYVEQTPMWGMGKDAAWREGVPGQQLLTKARSLGVMPSGPYRRGSVTRGELHDRVAIAEAASVLDA